MILKGKILADKIFEALQNSQAPRKRLVVICVGDDEVSTVYVGKKIELANRLGVEIEILRMSGSSSYSQIAEKISALNHNDGVGGILIQMPLPIGIDRKQIGSMILPEKDVDGFGYITGKSPLALPPTVLAIDALLDFYQISKANKKILIVGMGFLVGAPLYNYYKKMSLDVDAIEENDPDYETKLQAGDIVILATGGQASFKFNDFKSGAIIVDASTIASDNKIKGDLVVNGGEGNISYSPVPGGVGPVTVAMLFLNFYGLNGSRVDLKGLIEK